MEWLDEFLDSWEKVEGTTDWGTSKPFSDGSLTPYYYDLVTDRVLSAMDRVGMPKDPRTLFAGPSSLRTQIVVLFLMKYFGFSKKDRIKLATYYYNALRSFSKKDPFSYHGTNFVFTKQEISEQIKHLAWSKANQDSSKEVAKLSVSLAALAYALFTDSSPTVGREYSGPYNLRNGKTLIIRDFFFLKPVEVWPHCKKYKYNSIRIYSTYNNVKTRFDFYGNFTSDKNLVENLSAYSILADGKQLKTNVKGVSEYLAKLALAQADRWNTLDLEETKIKFMECDMYHHRKLLGAAGMDWKPTKEMLNRVKNKKLLKGFGPWGQPRKMSKSEIKHFGEIMDPRTKINYHPKVKI